MRILFLISFFILSAQAISAPRTQENAPWNVNFSTHGNNPAGYYGEWPGHSYHPSPSDWRNVPVYQFITDRFRDGNPRNNEGKYGGYDLYDVGKRHGGDFKGVQEALPYIKSLGFDAIWISPIFQNRYNSYHNYAQIDFTLLDDRFGTLEELRSMVDEAHRLGMYVIVDIVVNHMDNLLYFEGHEKGGAPFKFHEGEYKQHWRNPDEQYADFKINNTFFDTGKYSDVYGYDGYKKEDPGGGSFWESDFHHNGDLTNYDDVWANHLGKIYGIMDDLRVSHPRVQDKIIAMTKALISSADIDGIRMDTPMQVPLYFFKRWAPAVKEHAARLGKKNFFIFGEFFCPRNRAATMVGRGRTPNQWGKPFDFIDDIHTMDAGLNYDFYFSFVGPAIKSQTGQLSNAMSTFRADMHAYDFYNPNRGQTNYVMLNFINNHDQWRMNWSYEGFQKTMLGSSIIALWPGIPLYYYGDEQAFSSKGTALDGWSREGFMTSKAWYDVDSMQKPNPAIFDNFNMTHSHYLQVQKIMNVRRAYPALRETDEIYERWVQEDNKNGVYAFTRVWGDKKDWVLVAFNTWRDPLPAGGSLGNFYTGWNEGDTLVNILKPWEKYRLGKDGILNELWVGGYETKVLVREDNQKPLSPVVEFVSPGHDSVVTEGVQQIVVHFSESMNVDSVKGSLSVAGQRVDPGSLHFYDDNRKLSFKIHAFPGINHVVVGKQARARSGLSLTADFKSRFRVGDDLNPIVKTQKDFIRDADLVQSIEEAGGSLKVRLRHRANGAALLRVSLNRGKNWSDWETYKPETDLYLGQRAQKKQLDVWVQYWADGSAAYFSYDVIEPQNKRRK